MEAECALLMELKGVECVGLISYLFGYDYCSLLDVPCHQKPASSTEIAFEESRLENEQRHPMIFIFQSPECDTRVSRMSSATCNETHYRK